MSGDFSETIRKVRIVLFFIFMTLYIFLAQHISYVSIILLCNECCPFLCMCSRDYRMFCYKFLKFMICNRSHKDVDWVDMDFYRAKYAVELFVHERGKMSV